MNWELGSKGGYSVSGVVNFGGILRAVWVEGRSRSRSANGGGSSSLGSLWSSLRHTKIKWVEEGEEAWFCSALGTQLSLQEAWVWASKWQGLVVSGMPAMGVAREAETAARWHGGRAGVGGCCCSRGGCECRWSTGRSRCANDGLK